MNKYSTLTFSSAQETIAVLIPDSPGIFYPTALCVRNGSHYHGGETIAIVMTEKPATLLSAEDVECVKKECMQIIPGWDEIVRQEIHVLEPEEVNGNGLFVDNFGNFKSADEWAKAPELGVFPMTALAKTIQGAAWSERDSKDAMKTADEINDLISDAAARKKLFLNQKAGNDHPDSSGSSQNALLNDLWSIYLLAEALMLRMQPETEERKKK